MVEAVSCLKEINLQFLGVIHRNRLFGPPAVEYNRADFRTRHRLSYDRPSSRLY